MRILAMWVARRPTTLPDASMVTVSRLISGIPRRFFFRAILFYELDLGDFRAISLTRTKLDDARVTARTGGVARTKFLQHLVDGRFGEEDGVQLATGNKAL